MSRVVKTRDKQKKFGEETPTKSIDKISRDIVAKEEIITEMETEIPKMRVITPSKVASRWKIRVSIAGRFLKELEQKGLISRVMFRQGVSVYSAQKKTEGEESAPEEGEKGKEKAQEKAAGKKAAKGKSKASKSSKKS